MKTLLHFLIMIFLIIATPVLHATPGDADNDGLRDEVETGTGIYVSPENTGTKPNVSDSDGDSMPDGMEIRIGTNPNDPKSMVKRPNIILINCDDLGYGDIGCFWQNQRTGTRKFSTPHLDTMAAQGAKLTHHYVGAPVCAPSRSSLLQGRHQGHADIRDRMFDQPLPDNHSIASILKASGYHTVHVGKAGLAGNSNNGTPSAHPLLRGFSRYFGYLSHFHAHEHYPRNGSTEKRANIYDDYRKINDAYLDLYTSDAWTAFAKRTIIEEATLNPTRPFFIYLAYDTPHFFTQAPPTASYPQGFGISGGIQWEGPPSYASTAINDSSRIANPTNQHPSVDLSWPVAQQTYVSMIRRLDDSVADLLQTLRDLKIDDNTFVVFTSDNGPDNFEVNPTFFQSYAGFEGKKLDMWEGGIRVPTIVRWPGRIPSTNQLSNIRNIHEPSANYEWLATFAEIAMTPVPAYTDGSSLIPLLTGEGTRIGNSYLYFECFIEGYTTAYSDFSNHGWNPMYQMQAIRIGDYMGVRTGIASADDPFRIYNVVADLKQAIDLAAKEPDLQQRMKYLGISARRPIAAAPRPYDNTPLPCVSPAPVSNGLKWSSYEGYWPWLPEFRTLIPASSGTTSTPTPSLRSRNNDVGLFLEGYVQAPSTGAYTFQVSADSSNSLWIHEAHVIDNDYNYVPTKTGAPVHLTAGLHPIRLYYRHQSGTAQLQLNWSGPGFAMKPVPASAFFVDGPPPPPPDRDGDGSPDADELIAGTDPDDPTSVLRIQSISLANGGIRLRWPGVAGRTYRVQERSGASNWKPVDSLAPVVVSESGDHLVFIPGNSDSDRYFRIAVSITPPQPSPDRDGDGASDADELIAGTDPEDPNSFFRIHTFTKTESGSMLQWAGVAGRTYRVQESTDLKTWKFVPGVAPAVVTSPLTNASVFVPANGATNRFLRMQVMLTP